MPAQIFSSTELFRNYSEIEKTGYSQGNLIKREIATELPERVVLSDYSIIYKQLF
jgi:hypothetical protein